MISRYNMSQNHMIKNKRNFRNYKMDNGNTVMETQR